MVPQENPKADLDAIRQDLLNMTRRWGELPYPAMVEIRALAEHKTPQSAKFALDWFDGPGGAVDFAANMNALGCNVYVVRNPVPATTKGPATDADIKHAFFLWADCDDDTSARNVLNFVGPKWTAAVVTGTIPTRRVHTYWELEEPCANMEAWRQMQADIAARFGSDRVVINPSRIMRLGGTITYPATHKRAKGYVPELATIRTAYTDERGPVPFERMRQVFAPSGPTARATGPLWASEAQTGTFHMDTGERAPLDRERMAIQALSGKDWHHAVIRLVASYVSRGLTDGEIHGLTQPLTLPGYTPDQTAREVQTAIDGARRKGWTPEPQATPSFAPNFDHAPAPTASDPAPAAKTWAVQSAGDFTADFVSPEYVIDGIVQRGRVYTLTAPTGSGKTAVMLYAATAIAMGAAFCEKEVESGDVLFMAGENPDDVRARVIATMEFYNINPANCSVHFIAGTFSIRGDIERLREEAEKLPNLILVVVDTFAAYFDGDDENSNAQALDFARVIRKIAAFTAKPAVIMPAHPVKNATRGNLTPKGGSSLLNEVDGNLTLWNDAGMLSLHWQGKFRGAEFEPLALELQRFETASICDKQGRIIPTILAKPLLETRAIQIATDNMSKEDRLLISIGNAPELSMRDRCVAIGLTLADGRAHKSGLTRIIKKLEGQKLIRQFRTNWELTKDGERAVEMLTSGKAFAKEI